MKKYFMISFTLLSLILSGLVSAQTLAITSGTCPGPMTFTASNVTPNSTIFFIYAFGTGSVNIPRGLVCWGTTLGLNATATLGATVTSNGSGVASINVNVPASACNNVYLQALDKFNCKTTNVILIQ
jgi:hypothetical protein